jgi:hypothetical protein
VVEGKKPGPVEVKGEESEKQAEQGLAGGNVRFENRFEPEPN